jgi:hypothetical protein
MSADGVALLYSGLNMGVNVTLAVEGVRVTCCAFCARSTKIVCLLNGLGIVCILRVAYVKYIHF